MKLRVLMDNHTYIDRYFLGEPAVSYYIEVDGKALLFDVGYSDAYLRNAERMGIQLRKLDYIVLSHGHNDHTWGLDPLIRLYSEAKLERLDYRCPTIVAHPDVFASKLLQGQEIGSMLSDEKVARHFERRYSKEPVWLTDNLVYLGEIPRIFDFEGQDPIGSIARPGEEPVEDPLRDDSALVYLAKEGLVVIVGCSHSGICNTIEYARHITGEMRVHAVLGGFHLLKPSEKQISSTVAYFQKLNPKHVYACHCTDFPSKVALAEVAAIDEVGVGLQLEFHG